MSAAEEAVDPRRHPSFPDTGAPAPRANPELIGHREAEARIAVAAARGTIAGAWLIGGPEGIGKATLAFRAARFLLAGGGGPDLFGEAGDSLAVDEAAPVFARVAAGSHGDLMTVERSLNDKGRMRTEIVVDDVRRMSAFFRQSAGEGGWRVAIVDGAELMNGNAANAALKLIEEPPARSVVFLVSHAPSRLLPTIRSRCRKLHLHPLKAEQVALLLDGLPAGPGRGRPHGPGAALGGQPGPCAPSRQPGRARSLPRAGGDTGRPAAARHAGAPRLCRPDRSLRQRAGLPHRAGVPPGLARPPGEGRQHGGRPAGCLRRGRSRSHGPAGGLARPCTVAGRVGKGGPPPGPGRQPESRPQAGHPCRVRRPASRSPPLRPHATPHRTVREEPLACPGSRPTTSRRRSTM